MLLFSSILEEFISVYVLYLSVRLIGMLGFVVSMKECWCFLVLGFLGFNDVGSVLIVIFFVGVELKVSIIIMMRIKVIVDIVVIFLNFFIEV